MKRLIYILFLFMTIGLNAQYTSIQDLLDNEYDLVQHFLTYDTASTGMYVGYYYPPRWIQYCDTTTGTISFAIQSGNGGGYFALSDSLLTINSTPVIGTYYLIIKVTGSSGWSVSGTAQIKVVDADICSFDYVPSVGSWSSDSVYLYERGSDYSSIDIDLGDDDHNITIGTWGVGDKPEFNECFIGDPPLGGGIDLGSDSCIIYSLHFNDGVLIEPSIYDSLIDLTVDDWVSNGAIYQLPSDESDWKQQPLYIENCWTVNSIVQHGIKTHNAATIRNCVSGGSTDGHAYSLGGTNDIRYSYGYNVNQAGVEAAGDSTDIRMCAFYDCLSAIFMINGTAWGDNRNQGDTAMYNIFTYNYASQYSGIDVQHANDCYIAYNYFANNYNGVYLYADVSNNNYGIKIHANYFTNHSENAIWTDGETDSIDITFNVFDTVTDYAIELTGGVGYNIINNTLYNEGISNSGTIDSCYNNIYSSIDGTITNSGTNLTTSTDTIYIEQSTSNYRAQENATNIVGQGTYITWLIGVTDFYGNSIISPLNIGAANNKFADFDMYLQDIKQNTFLRGVRINLYNTRD